MTRTPALFPGRDPDALAIGEPLDHDLRSLWFGAGPHFCLGSLLAKAQLRAVFRMLRGRATYDRASAGRPRVLFPSYAELWCAEREPPMLTFDELDRRAGAPAAPPAFVDAGGQPV